jgi:sterol desaturase/sphingolipid hydroxylase (fatty acid hydroxylase superfamily)
VLTGLTLLVVVVIGLAVLAFEIAMFIDAIKNPKLSQTSKLVWLVAMLLVHPFVAIAYYFIARRNL